MTKIHASRLIAHQNIARPYTNCQTFSFFLLFRPCFFLLLQMNMYSWSTACMPGTVCFAANGLLSLMPSLLREFTLLHSAPLLHFYLCMCHCHVVMRLDTSSLQGADNGGL